MGPGSASDDRRQNWTAWTLATVEQGKPFELRQAPSFAARRGCYRDIRLTAWRAGTMLTAMTGTADHVRRNRAAWDRWAEEYAGPGLGDWAVAEPIWGIWGSPRCGRACCPVTWRAGTASSLAAAPGTCRRGWLAAARGRQGWTTPRRSWPLPAGCRTVSACGSRSSTPAPGRHPSLMAASTLRSRSTAPASGAIPTHGSPRRPGGCAPGGQLIFLVNSVLLMLTVPDTDGLPAAGRLLRPYFGMHRFEWPDDEPVEFHLGHGDMIRLLRGCGLEVEDLLELRPGPGATTRHPLATLEWARQWPCEEVWKARKLR
jgi:hypothetical protein